MPRYINYFKEMDTLLITVSLRDQIIEGSLPATIQYMVSHKINMSLFQINFTRLLE